MVFFIWFSLNSAFEIYPYFCIHISVVYSLLLLCSNPLGLGHTLFIHSVEGQFSLQFRTIMNNAVVNILIYISFDRHMHLFLLGLCPWIEMLSYKHLFNLSRYCQTVFQSGCNTLRSLQKCLTVLSHIVCRFNLVSVEWYLMVVVICNSLVVISSYYKWANWSSELLSNLFKLIDSK